MVNTKQKINHTRQQKLYPTQFIYFIQNVNAQELADTGGKDTLTVAIQLKL